MTTATMSRESNTNAAKSANGTNSTGERAERRLSLLMKRAKRALERRRERIQAAHGAEREAAEREAGEMGRLHRTFARMSDALRERDRERLHHLASAVHDLRSPLMVAGGAARQLRRGDVPPEEQGEWLDAIVRNVTTLEFLVCDLLEEARQEAGAAPRRQQVSLCDLSRDLVRDFGSVTRSHPLTFCGDCAHSEARDTAAGGCGDCMVWGDPEALRRLLFNLMSNAVKYSEAGREVSVSVWRREGSVCLLVEDDGKGIDPIARNERLFLPFVRLDETRHMVGGDGLGLASVKRIAQAHGAAITVQGAPGQGTTFEVSFPAVDTTEREIKAAEDSPQSSQRTIRPEGTRGTEK